MPASYFETASTCHALPPERQPPARRAAGGALPRWGGSVAAAEPAGRSSLHAQLAGAGLPSQRTAGPRRAAVSASESHPAKTKRPRESRASAWAICRTPCAWRAACGRQTPPRAARSSSRASRGIVFGKRSACTWLGLALAARGVARASESALRRSLRLFVAQIARTRGRVCQCLSRPARPVVRRSRRRPAAGGPRLGIGARADGTNATSSARRGCKARRRWD